MDITVGFDGIIEQNSWFPVLITLANDGAPVEGELVVTFEGPSTEWRSEVSLPTQSRKQIELTIFSSNDFRPLEVNLTDDSGNILLSASDNNLRRVTQEDGLIYGVVTAEPDSLEVLSKVPAGRSDVFIAYMSIDQLTTDPLALQPLDALIFNDIDTNGLTIDQRAALDTWLRQGGQIILTGGSSWQKTTAAFSDLLPVELTGTESVDTLSDFEGAIGVPFRDPGPYVVAQSSFTNGELVWRDGSTPILARRSIGGGNVWFLALDPQFAPLDDWDGSEALWASVARFIPQPMFWERGFKDTNSLADAVSTIPAIQLPSVWLVLGFMVFYILIVGPANYLVLNRIERRELAWLTLPITMFVFSAAALLIGLQFRGNRVVINQLSIVMGRADAESVRVDSAVGIFSPRRDSYNLTVQEGANIRYTDRFGFVGGNASRQPILTGNENMIDDLLIDVGDVSQFVASGFLNASPVTAEATWSPDADNEFNLVITNNSSDPIEDMLLLAGIKQVALFDIGPRETIERTISLPSAFIEEFEATVEGGPESVQLYAGVTDGYTESPIENGYSTLIEGAQPGAGYNYYSEPARRQRYNLLNSLYQTYNSEPVFIPTGQLILIGWSETRQIDVAVDTTRSDQVSSTLYFLEIPLTK
ncbi:MAG: hypothetical protein AAGD96_23260 [Chloroflexota bacterium]